MPTDRVQEQDGAKRDEFEENLVSSMVSSIALTLLEQRRRAGFRIYIPSLDLVIDDIDDVEPQKDANPEKVVA